MFFNAGQMGGLKMGGQEDLIIIEKTSLSIEGHVNGQNTCPKPMKYCLKNPKTKTTTRRVRPRPTGARSAPVDAFVVKYDYSMPGDVHSAYNYTYFVAGWQQFRN